MSTELPGITSDVRAFIEEQALFFVGTAPDVGGHVNISPKGLDSFRFLSSNRVGYFDLTGSGAETQAHIQQNGRIVVMFCALDAGAKIVRIHGRARSLMPTMTAFDEVARRHGLPAGVPAQGVRAFIEVDVDRVSRSCGFGVPEFEMKQECSRLQQFYDHKGAEGMVRYRNAKNAHSIDGLPVLPQGVTWESVSLGADDRDVAGD